MHVFQKLLAIILIIFLSPLLVSIAGLILVLNGSPVLFRANRAGKNGKRFLFYKFRTMSNIGATDVDSLDDELRITRLGSFLRKSSIDELPSLINIVKGEMVFVGPRPLLMEYLPLYNKEQIRRHEVLPGITGLAQISGRNAISWEEKFRLDVWYVDNQYILLDIEIILKTIFKVLKRDGISQEGHATMPVFRGENK